MHRIGTNLTRLGAAIVLIGAYGCGMSDSLARMDVQQRRIQEFDENNNLLDDPIDMPKQDDKPAWAWDRRPTEIFLRLPRGFGTQVRDKNPYSTNFPLFRFAADDSGYNLFVVAGLVADPEQKADFYGKYLPNNFQAFTKRALEDYYFKTHKYRLFVPDKLEIRPELVKRFTPYPEDAKSFVYQTYEFKDTSNQKLKEHSLFRVFYHESAGKQVCIVEQRPLRPINEDMDKTFRKAFAASLRTLDLGADAASKRAQFRKARG